MNEKDTAAIRQHGAKIVGEAIRNLRALSVARCGHEGLRADTQTGKVSNVLGPEGTYSTQWCTWCGSFRSGREKWRRPGVSTP